VYNIWRKNFQELLSNHIFGVGSFFKPHPVDANSRRTLAYTDMSCVFVSLDTETRC